MSYNIDREYDKMIARVRALHSDLDEWAVMNGYDVASSYATQYEAVQSMPSSVITKNARGEVIGTDLLIQVPQEFNPPAVINSNVPDTLYNGSGGNYGGSGYRLNGSGGGTSPNIFSSGAKSVGTGTKVLTVAGTVLSTFGAASLGAALGKAINANFGGEYAWTEADWEEWVSGKDPLDQAVFRTLFGIDNSGNTTMYLPEDMLASAYKMYLEMGVFGQETTEIIDKPSEVTDDVVTPIPVVHGTGFTCEWPSAGNTRVIEFDSPVDILFSKNGSTSSIGYTVCSTHSFRYRNGGSSSWSTASSTTVHGEKIYFTIGGMGWRADQASLVGHTIYNNSTYASNPEIWYTILFGTRVNTSPVEGISSDPRASTQIDPNVITGTTPQTILPQLKQNYPQLFDGSIYEDVPQEDGNTKRITYIPVPWPSKDEETGKTITGVPSQSNPQVDPTTETTDAIKDLIDTLTDFFTNPPDTGTGDGPVTALPVGEASSLWKIYNPTQAQVDAFGSWLWSSNFVEQIKKLFNDPMQAIIGIHKVFATPSIGGTATIKVGYLDSEVPSNYIDDQYTTVNCGTVNLREYFGNVFDYAPYTRVSLYLPFIGIVDLDVADVMRSSINVIYHVDVLTGACLADVKVTRDACGGVLYQYSGSAIVTYPVSSGNYMGMVAGVLSVASGIAGTVLSGGALAPALIGGAVGASHLHTDVSHSGGFSGCAGAMGAKKPYLIISRPQVAMANNYEHFTGIPANSHVSLSQCSGFTKVKSVYVGGMQSATDEEKDIIETQLKAGVLV